MCCIGVLPQAQGKGRGFLRHALLVANLWSIIVKPSDQVYCKPLCLMSANVFLTRACHVAKLTISGAGSILGLQWKAGGG